MTERLDVPRYLGQVVPGVRRFQMFVESLGSRIEGYIVVNPAEVVMIDPLPMRADDLSTFRVIDAIVLTSSSHERSSGCYREIYPTLVWAPEGAEGFYREPDRRYNERTRLAAWILPIHTPGPNAAHYSLFLRSSGGVLFSGDLVTNFEGQGLQFLPDEYMDDPAAARESVRKLLPVGFHTLCPAHGEPITENVKDELRALLERDASG